MKLAVSNIAWEAPDDEQILKCMKEAGFSGLEIAPTRLFPAKPYDQLQAAREWKSTLQAQWGMEVPSMQSIWYGQQESIFGSSQERAILIEYTQKAIDFAAAIGCKNLVFGCPRNRNLPDGKNSECAVAFFRELGEYAISQHTVIGMEANPPIYHTNYINDTTSAFELIERVDSAGFKLNLDVGTMIYNQESVHDLVDKVHLIHHVHISEPQLKPIEPRKLHRDLLTLLRREGYDNWISIEMGKTNNTLGIENAIHYISSLILS